MSSKKPVPAVRPASRRRPGPPAGDLEATRIARVDLRTGQELAQPGVDPDATIIGAAAVRGAPPRPVTAEVVPPRDFRHSQEVTAAWAESEPGAGRCALRRLLVWPGRSPLVIAAGAVAVVLVAGTLVLGPRATEAKAAGGREVRAGAEGPVEDPTGGAATAAIATPGTDGGPDPAGDLHQADVEPLGAEAAAALADGRLEDARALYARLAAVEPEDRRWSLALEILAASGAAR